MDRAFTTLRELYTRLDAELAMLAPACSACGNCCDFERAGHILYATELETRYAIAQSPPPPANDFSRCPYQDGSACTARAGRPLGCRVYFCEESEALEALSTRLHEQLRALHTQYAIPYRYAPFLPLLRERRGT